jgi:hypothetical protein
MDLEPTLVKKQPFNVKNVLALFIDFKNVLDLVYPKLLLPELFHYGFDNAAL